MKAFTNGMTLVAAVWLLGAVAVADPPRFTALLQGGQRIEGGRFHNWHALNQMPHLDGHQLLNPGNPMMWLRDRELSPGELPPAYIETTLGDRLPGEVVGSSSDRDTFQSVRPHVLVKPAIELHPPGLKPHEHVRVLTKSLAKVVWKKVLSGEDYLPGTLIYRDGRQQSFRSARFRGGQVQLLLASGRQSVAYRDIAELHLPRQDPWRAYYRELAVLTPDFNSRLLTIDTVGGLVATGSTSRLQTVTHGNHGDFTRWWHAVQPAWSLDTLWVKCDRIWARRLWWAHEPPLSRFRPTVAVSRGMLGKAGWPWRCDRSVKGAVISSLEAEHGGGFGAHAFSELTFDLPPLATHLRTRISLDRSSGNGGCVLARVLVGEQRQQIYQSPHLVGAKQIVDTNWLNLANLPPDKRRVALQVDPAHQGRPARADPLNVRDAVNWCDPMVRLDLQRLKEQVTNNLPNRMPAFHGWDVRLPKETSEAGEISYFDQFEDFHRPQPGVFLPGVKLNGGPLALVRHLTVRPQDQWLLVMVYSHGGALNQPEIRVSIDGIVVKEAAVPVRANAALPPPLVVSLSPYVGHEIEIRIEQLPLDRNPHKPVHWLAARVVDQLPTLYRALEERGTLAAWGGGVHQESLVKDPYYGERAVLLKAGQKLRLDFPQPLAVKASPSAGEVRFVRFASRKAGKGVVELTWHTEAPRDQPAVHQAGKLLVPPPKDAPPRQVVSVWNLELPEQWIVSTRDLYTDFGEVKLTGVTLSAPDGEAAWVDHIYLAQTAADFALLPAAPSPELTNQTARRELAQAVLNVGHPATIALHIDDRQATGVLIGGEGFLVTAGHVLSRPGKEFEVQLTSGQRLPAKVLGIDRASDIGLAQITDRMDLPLSGVAISDQAALPGNQLYVGFAYEPFEEEPPGATAHIVGIKRDFLAAVWTDFQPPRTTIGGPLFSRDGRVVGIHTTTSQFGGFLYSKTAGTLKEWERLKRGEVWGDWFPGTGPMLGVIITNTQHGAQVSNVMPDSPAAAAGMQVNDLVTKIDGQNIRGLEDMYRFLSAKNPEDEVAVEFTRDGQGQSKRLKLMPRTP